MKQDKFDFDEFFVVGYIAGVIFVFIITGILGVITADKAMTAAEPDPSAWNDVTFAYLETADNAGTYFYYDVDTGIVYKGGKTAFKPVYSDDGRLLVWRDGKMEEVR